MESIIDDIEKELPPIKTFFMSGGQNYPLYLIRLEQSPEGRKEESWK